MGAPKLSLANLSTEDQAKLIEQYKAHEAKTAADAKAARERAKSLASDVVTLVTTSDIPRQTFTSTAEGWSLGGKFEGADGKTYRVSVLLRDEATIPKNTD